MKSYRIALAQINPSVGDLENNTKKIIKLINEFKEKADLLVFPELCLVGYPPEDLILRNALLEKVLIYINKIHKIVKKHKIGVILGAPLKLKNGIGNAAIYLIGNKRIVLFKNNLPNYGVFDEKRIFLKGPKYKCIKFKKLKIGLMICEDMWTEEVAKSLIKDKADFFICINASPFDHDKLKYRKSVASKITRLANKPLMYVNQVGGQDELVFDGSSFVIGVNGNILNNLAAWKEEVKLVEVNLDKKANIIIKKNRNNILVNKNFNTWSALVLGLRDYVYKNSFKKIILGLSGGIDSAVSAAIAVDAVGSDNVIGLKLPSKFSSLGSLIDAEKTADLLKIKTQTLKINTIHQQYLKALNKKFNNELLQLTNENLQSRIRGSILMAYSNNYSYLLISTGNKSEMSVGYSTIYGDMNGGFNVLKDIYKTELYELAKWRNSIKKNYFKGPKGHVIPVNSIEKEPSAELSLDQKDSDSLPPYEVLDKILYYFIEKEYSIDQIIKKGFKLKPVKRIRELILVSEYKRRQAPPGVKLSIKSFGKERRYPITNLFKF